MGANGFQRVPTQIENLGALKVLKVRRKGERRERGEGGEGGRRLLGLEWVCSEAAR
jgi:hypothetical protein